MRRACLATVLWAAACGAPAHAAFVGFTGPYAAGQWNTTVTGNLTGAAGGGTSLSTTSLSITGGNAVGPDPGNFAPACTNAITGVAGPCQVSFVTSNIANPFVFDWLYVSSDSAGAANDLFGMLIDGVRVQLSDPGGAPTQSGHASVTALSTFGWYLNCTDCIEGAATARITDFQAAAVPEPGTMALLGFGVVAAGAARRRRVHGPLGR